MMDESPRFAKEPDLVRLYNRVIKQDMKGNFNCISDDKSMHAEDDQSGSSSESAVIDLSSLNDSGVLPEECKLAPPAFEFQQVRENEEKR